MKKLMTLFLIASILLTTSCAHDKQVTVGTIVITAKPYGWINQESAKKDGVQYQLSAGNIIWSILLCETIVAPVLLTGFALYEPIGSTTCKN